MDESTRRLAAESPDLTTWSFYTKRRAIGVLKRVRNLFFTGLAVLLPVMLTFVGLRWLANSIDDVLAEPIAILLHRETPIWGLGIVGVLLLIFVAGALSEYFLGQKLIEWGEAGLQKIPLVKSLYGLVKQVTDSLFNPAQQTLNRVCVMEYPVPGVYRVGFVTSVMEGPEGRVASIFLPTTPNPAAGWVVFMPEGRVELLDVRGEDAMKLVVSAGVMTLKDEAAAAFAAAVARLEERRKGGIV